MTYRVAVVGAGPSGFYTAEALLDSGLAIEIDVIERRPTPFGLVRYGIAPDHQKLKAISASLSSIAQRPGFQFVGNVTVDRDIALAELRSMYDAVVLAYGAAAAKSLDIPGHQLTGVHSADSFVGWVNGRPDEQETSFDLSQESAVIIGHGNVALDVCRILCKTTEELKGSDIPRPVLDALAESCITDVHLVGRRGPSDAKFTRKELRALGELSQAQPIVEASDLDCQIEGSPAPALIDIFRTWSKSRRRSAKRIHFHFRALPSSFTGVERLERALFERDAVRLGTKGGLHSRLDTLSLACGLAFTSVGYRGVPMSGVPFDFAGGIVANKAGRVTDSAGGVEQGLYVVGWLKRGASGVVGTNRACGEETAAAVIADLRASVTAKSSFEELDTMLDRRGIRTVSFADWLRIDAAEVQAGASAGQPREKFLTHARMLAAIDAAGLSNTAS